MCVYPMQILALSMLVNTSVTIGTKISVRPISCWNIHSDSQKEEVRALSFLDAKWCQFPFLTEELLLGIIERCISMVGETEILISYLILIYDFIDQYIFKNIKKKNQLNHLVLPHLVSIDIKIMTSVVYCKTCSLSCFLWSGDGGGWGCVFWERTVSSLPYSSCHPVPCSILPSHTLSCPFMFSGAAANMLELCHQALPSPCLVDSDDVLSEFQNLSQYFIHFRSSGNCF